MKPLIPELLAPAGGMEQLRYALNFGADAVYLATDKFGLRERAQNFTVDNLAEAVAFAHERNARVYVTCNAYAHDTDLSDLPRYARAIEDAGADAAIVSDLGIMSIIKENAPSLALHVSTQASVSNAAAARVWYELGATRVVCAREMSLAEIAQFKQDLPDGMEVEAFVHGAMCMAISGRCLISDYLADRSANRGHCAQPCRWGYTLQEPSRPGQEFDIEEDGKSTYIMNSKDLNMLARLQELADAGIDSIKIEGRVKKAFYVATVVNAYRQVLDGAPWQEWAGELDTISHRPYSTGFYFGPAEQSHSADIYTQLYDWVAAVVESCPLDADNPAAGYRTVVHCRNRFYEGDELEVLSPHSPIDKVVVSQLKEVFDQPDGTQAFVDADIANKAMGQYCFVSNKELHPYDMLRARRKDPSQKN